MDVVIEGRAWFNGRLEQCCIGIKDGKIAAVKRTLNGEKVYHYQDKIILPGAIDPHVHLREPGFTHKEDFATGTLAAACGGVTCVFDMPNTQPATITLDALREKREIARRKACIDFGLFAGVTPDNDLGAMAKEAVGLKMFMGSSTQSILVYEDAGILRALKEAERLGKVLSVHAEDERMMTKAPEHSLSDHATNRPPKSEVRAIERLAAPQSKAKVNICHISSAEGLEAVRKTGFTKEATMHHILLDASSDLKGMGKVNPPLRSREDREAVYYAFMQGKIDMLASDHAPHTMDEKGQEFSATPSGVPGVETSVPMLLALVKKGKLDMSVLVRCCSQNAADLFGLKKGRIAVGYDADLMMIDPADMTKINVDELHSKCGWIPYEGQDALFPAAVFLRGEELIRDAHMVGERQGRDVIVH
ncbi:MAG: dihydroorotase [Methanomassiliicoccales archaeon PtaU1.Bin124]|nr:MAG: dihydroorotase [Methanomassiliicoccales archaeon PtaU1.Bin124]